MAEILVKAGVQINAYEPGDIIVVREDGFKWGKSELDKSLFNVIKFPGEPVEKYQGFVEELKKFPDLSSVPIHLKHLFLSDAVINAETVKPRKYQIVNNTVVSK